MSEATSCGGQGNDYINGAKQAYRGWIEVVYVEGQGPDYYQWIADNSHHQGISIPVKSFEEFKVMYGDGHKYGPNTGEWDETINANIPLPAKDAYKSVWVLDGKYNAFINDNEDYRCWFEITGGSVLSGGAESMDSIKPIYAVQGEKELHGTSCQDAVIGSAGSDSINALGGDDYLDGGLGNDTLHGSHGNDLLHGRDGLDVLYGNQGDDDLYGAEREDIIYGGKGSDAIYGNTDDDELYGNIGNDYLYGGQGDDVIYAGQGDDLLYGNKGNDTLYGNKGADTFVCTKGFDVIKDFWGLDGDKISVASLAGAMISEKEGSTLITSGEGQLLLEGFARQFFDESQYLV